MDNSPTRESENPFEFKKPVLVSEIFGPTIQGEGPMCGKRSHFIRFAGCPYRCEWCDTPYAVLPELIKEEAIKLGVNGILEVLNTQGLVKGDWITLTGGDPCMWDLYPLVRVLLKMGLRVQVETQGSLYQHWPSACHTVVISPKPPSSGMANKLDMDLLRTYSADLGSKMHLKIVIFDELDLAWASLLHYELPKIPMYFSCGTPQGKTAIETSFAILDQLNWLCNKVLEDPRLFRVTVLPQLHVLAWGTKRGV